MRYLHRDVERVARQMLKEEIPYRRAFARHLIDVAEALHDVEWVDDSDYGPGDDEESIMKCINKADVIDTLIEDARVIVEALSLLVECDKIIKDQNGEEINYDE